MDCGLKLKTLRHYHMLTWVNISNSWSYKIAITASSVLQIRSMVPVIDEWGFS